MRFVWLIVVGLGAGLLAGQVLKNSNFAVSMLIGAGVVTVIALVDRWYRSNDR